MARPSFLWVPVTQKHFGNKIPTRWSLGLSLHTAFASQQLWEAVSTPYSRPFAAIAVMLLSHVGFCLLSLRLGLQNYVFGNVALRIIIAFDLNKRGTFVFQSASLQPTMWWQLWGLSRVVLNCLAWVMAGIQGHTEILPTIGHSIKTFRHYFFFFTSWISVLSQPQCDLCSH